MEKNLLQKLKNDRLSVDKTTKVGRFIKIKHINGLLL
jgi:hypothetical protein